MFVSPTAYGDPIAAQSELALPGTPTAGYYEIPESRLPGLTEPSLVNRDFGHPGWGLECWVRCPVDITGLSSSHGRHEDPHLVAYDYGQGAVWAVVIAESTAQIEGDCPELTLVKDRPAWMTDEELAKVRGHLSNSVKVANNSSTNSRSLELTGGVLNVPLPAGKLR